MNKKLVKTSSMTQLKTRPHVTRPGSAPRT